jgi:uncharacterized protein YdaL
MKRIALLMTVLVGVLFSSLAPPAQAQTTAPRALVLYDNVAGPYEKLGMAYAIMLRNLLGHFSASVDLVPVQSYTAGRLEGYQATFYIGSHYDNLPPAAFLADVSTTAKTVVWMKHNLWHLAWNAAYTFSERTGIAFDGLRGMNAEPNAANPAPGFFNTIAYQGKSMVKYYAFNAATGAISADPDIGVTHVVDAAKAAVVVNVNNPLTGEQAPYVMRSGNFWYFADIPFSYIGPRDRYLVICDLLHDILGRATPVDRRALVRLEDVGALVDPATMTTLVNDLRLRNAPFSIAAIPFYRDPLGVYNGGVPQEIHLSAATNLRSALNYGIANGGKIVMHGYSHQYASTPNPHNAVSGDDFEFWDAVNNRPVAGDSVAYATARMMAGIAELRLNRYTPFAWEAPHYQSSPLAMRAVPRLFRTTYQRAVYYTSDSPRLQPGTAGTDFAVGQFFPYIINTDYYGQRVLPENLGNIEYDIRNIDPTSNFNYTWQDLCTNAEYATVVRNGFASFFFHPFWLEPEIGVPGFQDFQRVMTCVSNLGYRWVDASTAQ